MPSRYRASILSIISLKTTIVGQAEDGHVTNSEVGWGTRAICGEDGMGDTLGQKCHDTRIIARAIRAPVIVVCGPKIPTGSRMRMRGPDKQAIHRDTGFLDDGTRDLQMQ